MYTKNDENLLIAELKELISKFRRVEQVIQRPENKHLLEFINYKTPKLQDDVYTNVTKIYWVINKLTDFPKCINPNCNNVIGVGINVKLSKNRGYNTACSVRCGALSPERNKKISATAKRKYGVSWPSKVQHIKEKVKQTNLERYGTECPLQNEKIQNKAQQTNLKKFGVSIANQFNSTDEIREQYEDTCLEKYGVDHPWKNEEVLENRRNTWIEKYSVDNPTKCEKVLTKIKNTCLEKYGVENPYQSREIQEKIKQTNLERYGVENVTQLPEIQEKMQQTCLKRYGVRNYAQSSESRNNKYSRFNYDDIYFDSKAELSFYKKCKNHGISINRSQKRFKYTSNDIEHYYFPDFEVNGRLVEIKGDHLLSYSQTGNIIGLHNPFSIKSDGNKLTVEEVLLENIQNKAKYQCMIDNNVIIIKSSEVDSDEIYNEFITS